MSLYIPFQGFSMIAELGEEPEDPVRNIPRVLMVGMGLAVLMSGALVGVLGGLDGWQELGALREGGIAQAAADYLPAWVSGTVVLGGVLGAFTTLNAIITACSRTLMRAGRDGVLPPRLAELSPRTQVPYPGVLALTVPPMAVVVVQPSVVAPTVFLALVILFGNFVGSIALWNLPRRFPAAYEHAIYRLRVRQLGRRGIDLPTRLRQLHGHEAATADVAPPPRPHVGDAPDRVTDPTPASAPAPSPEVDTTPRAPQRPRRILVATPPPSRRGAQRNP